MADTTRPPVPAATVANFAERPGDPYATKSAWGPGPWQDEPDRLEWQDAATGLPCLLVRGPLGALCGYVAVPPGHPLHGKPYHDVEADISAHGGLTYAGACQGAICHTSKPGEPDNVWWFGFDCGHCEDLVPKMEAYRALWEHTDPEYKRIAQLGEDAGIGWPCDTYKTVPYVQEECAALAEQLAGLATPPPTA